MKIVFARVEVLSYFLEAPRCGHVQFSAPQGWSQNAETLCRAARLLNCV